MVTAEKKAMLEKIFTHQFEGIMFHFDYARIAKLLGHEKIACLQHKHVMKETQRHLDTILKLIEVYGETFYASNGKLTCNAICVGEKPSSKELADNICREMLEKWKDWECKTVQLYDEAVHTMPECRIWKCLKREAEKELEYVSKLLVKAKV